MIKWNRYHSQLKVIFKEMACVEAVKIETKLKFNDVSGIEIEIEIEVR